MEDGALGGGKEEDIDKNIHGGRKSREWKDRKGHKWGHPWRAKEKKHTQLS